MMIKYAALICLFVVMSQGQRSPYAGSPNRYPQVLPRFQDQQTSSTTVSTTAAEPNVAQRVNGDSESTVSSSSNVPSKAPSTAAATPSVIPTTSAPRPTLDLPIDALGYGYQYDEIKNWPEELQPFWFRNRVQIAQHLNPPVQQNVQQPGTNSASFFAG